MSLKAILLESLRRRLSTFCLLRDTIPNILALHTTMSPLIQQEVQSFSLRGGTSP